MAFSESDISSEGSFVLLIAVSVSGSFVKWFSWFAKRTCFVTGEPRRTDHLSWLQSTATRGLRLFTTASLGRLLCYYLHRAFRGWSATLISSVRTSGGYLRCIKACVLRQLRECVKHCSCRSFTPACLVNNRHGYSCSVLRFNLARYLLRRFHYLMPKRLHSTQQQHSRSALHM